MRFALLPGLFLAVFCCTAVQAAIRGATIQGTVVDFDTKNIVLKLGNGQAVTVSRKAVSDKVALRPGAVVTVPLDASELGSLEQSGKISVEKKVITSH